MTTGRAGRRDRAAAGAADRHRRGGRALAGAADGHVRLRPHAVRPLRPRAVAAGGARRAARVRRRRARPGALRRRHRRPGLRRRPAGRLPRRPQPRPDRPRRRGDALVAARLRPHVVDEPRAGDAAQPDGLQGRNEQHQARGRSGAGRARVGSGELRSALAARRHLPGHAPHPHADRGLGPGEPRRSGADDRPPQGERRSVRPGGRVRPRQPLANARRRAHPPGGAE